MNKTWTVILNPCSGSGRGKKDWPKIEGLLKASGIAYELHISEYPGHAIDLARDLVTKGGRFLLSVGGDGTAHEVANGILTQTMVPSTEVVLGVIPVGTGNDLGRTLGFPSNYKGAIAALTSGKTFLQDVGTLSYMADGKPANRYFINIAGMGYDAQVGEYVNELKAKGRGGQMVYFQGLLKCLMRFQPIPSRYEINDQVFDKDLFSITVGICKYFGGGMKPCPDAIPDDGLLDVTVLHGISKFKLITTIVPGLFNGSFVKRPEVTQFRTIRVAVKGQTPLLVQADGENVGQGPAEFGIVEKALRVAVSA